MQLYHPLGRVGPSAMETGGAIVSNSWSQLQTCCVRACSHAASFCPPADRRLKRRTFDLGKVNIMVRAVLAVIAVLVGSSAQAKLEFGNIQAAYGVVGPER